jgi:hypothetical protein
MGDGAEVLQTLAVHLGGGMQIGADSKISLYFFFSLIIFLFLYLRGEQLEADRSRHGAGNRGLGASRPGCAQTPARPHANEHPYIHHQARTPIATS